MKSNGNSGSLIIVGSSLKAGENGLVDFFGQIWVKFYAFLSNHNDCTTGTAQSFVGSGHDDMGVGNGTGVNTTDD